MTVKELALLLQALSNTDHANDYVMFEDQYIRGIFIDPTKSSTGLKRIKLLTNLDNK